MSASGADSPEGHDLGSLLRGLSSKLFKIITNEPESPAVEAKAVAIDVVNDTASSEEQTAPLEDTAEQHPQAPKAALKPEKLTPTDGDAILSALKASLHESRGESLAPPKSAYDRRSKLSSESSMWGWGTARSYINDVHPGSDVISNCRGVLVPYGAHVRCGFLSFCNRTVSISNCQF